MSFSRLSVAILLAAAFSASAQAAVTPAEAAQLKTTLTPLGANVQVTRTVQFLSGTGVHDTHSRFLKRWSQGRSLRWRKAAVRHQCEEYGTVQRQAD